MTPIEMMLQDAIWTPIENVKADDSLPYATHSGVLEVPGFDSLKCWRLSNGKAMIDAEDMARFFGFESPEALANGIAEMGNPDLAQRLRKPMEFWSK